MRNQYYRPDIDGLRAIAVLSVVIFHAFPGHLRGGFVGVDVFFVISGYLITGDLYRRGLNGSFSIREFYVRRIRRVFPALAIVALAVMLIGAATLSAYGFRNVGVEVAAGTGFISNLYYWQTLNYFSAGAITKPLLHLWSLGVEEQFYIVWPILIYALAKRRSGVLVYILAIAIASFAYSMFAISANPAEAFFSPLTRFWELASGGALAVSNFKGKARNALSIGGLAGLLTSLVTVHEVGFPGYQALLPVLSTVAIIAAGPSGFCNRLLGMRAPVTIGLISYPLYLWHWPILSFAYIAGGYAYGPASYRAVLVVLAISLATFTYLTVERRGRIMRPAILVASIAAIGVSGLITYGAAGWPGRPAAIDPANALIGKYEELHQEGLSSAYLEKCDFLTWRQQSARSMIDLSCTAANSRPVWMLWGDSHAQALSLGLRMAMPSAASFVQVATSACTPRWSAETRESRAAGAIGTACVRSNDLAVSTIARVHPDVLFVSMNEGYGGRDWNAFADEARKLGAKKIVLIGPAPQFSPSLPALMARLLPKQPLLIAADPAPIAQDHDLMRLPAESYQYISLISLLCRAGECRSTVGTSLTAVDGSHLTPSASILVGRHIVVQIQ